MYGDELESTARWFLARSDVEAALKLLATLDGDAIDLDNYRQYIYKFWPSLRSEFGEYDRVYETAGKIEAQVDGESVVRSVAGQWRLQTIVQLIRQVMPYRALLLDFGCSRGAHAINISNQIPDKLFTLLDIDELSIVQAKNLVSRFATHSASFGYIVGDETSNLPVASYDGVLLFEVLEHVKDAKLVIDKVESSVKQGGWIFITLPSGPVEYGMWKEHPERLREHVREFQLDDIYDVFGQKQNLIVQYRNYGISEYLGQYIGCFVIAYRTGEQTGEIDWRRKLSTVRKFDESYRDGFKFLRG